MKVYKIIQRLYDLMDYANKINDSDDIGMNNSVKFSFLKAGLKDIIKEYHHEQTYYCVKCGKHVGKTYYENDDEIRYCESCGSDELIYEKEFSGYIEVENAKDYYTDDEGHADINVFKYIDTFY